MAFDWAGSLPRAEVVDFLEGAGARLAGYADLDEVLDDPTRGFASAAALVEKQAARYQEPFRLVVVGDFNTGKSSLINALLGREKFLVERRVATTGTITELQWAAEEKGEVFASDGRLIFSGGLGDAVKYADQNSAEGKSLAKQGARIVLHLDSPLLRNLILIDTPGLGSSDRDNQVTRDALDLADGAILVVSALQPGSEETRQLAEWLRTHGRRVLVAVSWLDRVGDPDEPVNAISELLASVIDKEPIRVNSPAIHKDLAAFEKAELHADEEAAAAAREQLTAHGYADLVERIQGDFAFGEAGLSRLHAAMASVAAAVRPLADAARRSSAAAQQEADAAHAEVSDLFQRVHTMVPRQARFINEKIDEAVGARVSEFIARFGDGVELFIDKLAVGGMKATARAVRSFTEKGRTKVAEQVRRDFNDLFPNDQLNIVVSDVTRAVSAQMEADWGEAASAIAPFMPADTFNIDAVTRDVTRQVAAANAQAIAASATWITLLFGPAGLVFDVAAFVLTSLRLKPKGPGKEATIALQKREARVRIGNMRDQLVHSLGEHYRGVNEATRKSLIAQARQEQSDKEREYDGIQSRLHRLSQAIGELGRIEADANGLSGQGAA